MRKNDGLLAAVKVMVAMLSKSMRHCHHWDAPSGHSSTVYEGSLK